MSVKIYADVWMWMREDTIGQKRGRIRHKNSREWGEKVTKSDDPELGTTTQRIENLTDGIFSIAMKLLVLNLALPEMGTDLTPATELHDLLFRQTHEFLNYVLSFHPSGDGSIFNNSALVFFRVSFDSCYVSTSMVPA